MRKAYSVSYLGEKITCTLHHTKKREREGVKDRKKDNYTTSNGKVCSVTTQWTRQQINQIKILKLKKIRKSNRDNIKQLLSKLQKVSKSKESLCLVFFNLMSSAAHWIQTSGRRAWRNCSFPSPTPPPPPSVHTTSPPSHFLPSFRKRDHGSGTMTA